MTNTFKVGDKVNSDFTENAGEITYGPYPGSYGNTSFLVRLLDGDHKGREVRWAASRMRLAAPVFEAGDLVVGQRSRTEFEVVLGPVKALSEDAYVVKESNGDHRIVRAALLESGTSVRRPLNSHTYAGVTYDLDAKYRDRNGHVWRFTSPLADGEYVRLNSDIGMHTDLAYLVASRSPLTKV